MYSVVVVFAEIVAALILSAVSLEVYRTLRRRAEPACKSTFHKDFLRKAISRDAVTLDLFLVFGSLVAAVLWVRVLSYAVTV